MLKLITRAAVLGAVLVAAGAGGCSAAEVEATKADEAPAGEPTSVSIEPLTGNKHCQSGLPDKAGEICCAPDCQRAPIDPDNGKTTHHGQDGCADSGPSGRADCSFHQIRQGERSCEDFGPPCIIDPDPFCKRGKLNSDQTICCPDFCDKCASNGCGSERGGEPYCCGNYIRDQEKTCSQGAAPCIFEGGTPAGDPTCANGIKNSDGSVCCALSCGPGHCGVSNCASYPGGEAGCCGHYIREQNDSCATHQAPCLLKPAFTHPGVFNSQAELTRIYTRRQTEPTKSALDPGLLSATARCSDCFATPSPQLASRSYPYKSVAVVTVGHEWVPDNSKPRWRDDMSSAYANALKWVASDDSRNAIRAMDILNAWARGSNDGQMPPLQKVVFAVSPDPIEHPEWTSDEGQVALECAWMVPIIAATAEILRYYRDQDGDGTGWKDADFQATQRMLSYLADKAKQSLYQETNQGASAALAQIAAGVVTDNRTRYNEGIQAWKSVFPRSFFNKDGAVTDLMNRDHDATHCEHAQYQVIASAQLAEIDYQQGGKIYDLMVNQETKSRLLQAHELLSYRFLGNGVGTFFYDGANRTPAPCDPFRGMPGYEIAWNHYIVREHLSLAWVTGEGNGQTRHLDQYVTHQDVRPDGNKPFFAGWSTLTHGNIAP